MPRNLREGLGEINAAAARPPQPGAVRAALDMIRPGFIADGGNVEFLSVEEDGTVRVALQGACTTCASQELTLRCVLEPHLREAVAGVTAVVVD